MTHKALSVAAAMLEKARDRNIYLTPMQLLKLVYIAHGWTLGLLSRPLVDDDVEAWRYGPVIPAVYHAVKHYRDSPVSRIDTATPAHLDPEEADIVDQVLTIYGDKNGIMLSSITHQPNTPWDKTWRSFGKNAVISNDVIEAHYASLYEKSKPQETSPA
ncbi:hypothetical protein B9Q17_00850 [Marinobacter vinifirmus]|uniref:Antitoxin SocA-like Panacea domain-containing protein n=1 Tax=Marinobacter vinifirmus TaxID=355591 RepID=A0A7Z1DTG6_9GAMM|nr:type II toxin-antitoxin system antitoxin SocA domain-containing protein [Marinobacter vinifirmus]OZC35628.1 hypothetical protein B9Q17_00850 [Marinobacter vinifirmus]